MEKLVLHDKNFLLLTCNAGDAMLITGGCDMLLFDEDSMENDPAIFSVKRQQRRVTKEDILYKYKESPSTKRI